MSQARNDTQDNRASTGSTQQLDLMIRQGRSFSGNERNCVFLNTRGTDSNSQRFANVSAVSGLDFPDDARALAGVDWDHDGDLDFWISNRNAPRIRLLRNDAWNKNHFVQFRLIGNGTNTNTNGVGARITVEYRITDNTSDDTQRIIKTLRAGEGFITQSTGWVQVGLGRATEIQRVIVRWPNGDAEIEEFTGIEMDGRFELRQGTGKGVEIPRRSRELAVKPSDIVLPPARITQRIPLVHPLPAPELTYLDFAGQSVTAKLDDNRATLVNLWSTTCRPCIAELTEFVERKNELEQAGVRLIALSIDGLESDDAEQAAKAAKGFVEKHRIPFETGMATQSLIERFRRLHNLMIKMENPLPMPASFLIDRNGKLDVIYKGVVSVDRLWEDAATKSYTSKERFKRAAAFPGSVIESDIINSPLMAAADHFDIARELTFSGMTDDAYEAYQTVLKYLPESGVVYNDIAILLLKLGNTKSSLEHFQKAVEVSPEDADIRINRARALAASGSVDKAIAELEHALTFAPENAEVYFNLGVMLIQTKDFAGAKLRFEQAVQFNARHSRALFSLGNLAMRNSQAAEAKHYYLRALEITPFEPTILTSLGQLHFRDGELDQAAERFKAAIRFSPSYADAHYNLGLVHMRNQQPEDARREFETTLRIDANHRGARAAIQQVGRGL